MLISIWQMKTSALLLRQLDETLQPLQKLHELQPPPSGWLTAIRHALGMPLRVVAKRLKTTPQGIRYLESSERSGSISIKKLRKMADALEMDLVYYIVPRKTTLQKMLQNRSEHVAKDILTRTARTMSLENQATSEKELKRAIADMSQELQRTRPRFLWD